MTATDFAPPGQRQVCLGVLALGLAWLVALALPAAALAQTQPAATSPVPTPDPAPGAPVHSGAASELRGRTVQDVRISGNASVATPVILNVVRTRPGEAFDPATTEEDIQRIYGLRKFSDVEAKVEPVEGGVIVAFEVTEQRQVNSIGFRGNENIGTPALEQVVDIKQGQSIDAFRITLSRQGIEELYRERNYPFAEVTVDEDALRERGDVVFVITEGPRVKVRKVGFVGNRSFTDDRLKGQIRTRSWVWIFRPGTFDAEQVEDDVAALRRYYASKGFFDARVGRKLVFSPDQSEMQVNYLIEEGPRYTVDRVSFRGNNVLSEADLRKDLRLTEGRPYDAEAVQRDVRTLVRAYSPYGYIYVDEQEQQRPDPDYLRIRPREVFRREAGTVELVYDISEGKPFKVGRIIVKGNTRTQDKVVLREMRVAPGQLYNSGELQDARERLRGTPYFTGINITPIGNDPEYRDLLVEVVEARTATFNVGAGINSNGGVGGNITYEQRNFDITNPPDSFGEIFTDRAFVGAGQTFRVSLEPGTENTNAVVRFSEPYLFDQPYSFSGEVYYRDRERRDYDDTRAGGRVAFGKRFSYVYSALLSLRGEDVEISDIEDPIERAPEINDLKGHSTLTSVGLSLRRDTTTRGLLPSRGSVAQVGWESFGALGGDFTFQKFTASVDRYFTLYEDLLDRRTVLALHADAGFIANEAPFFERFYAGGIGSVRGFRFRGISPRSGLDEDPVGGDFTVTGSAEINFPLAGENLRGVTFFDAGTVEEEFEINKVRTSVGAGIRLILPIFGQAPLAIDAAVPITDDDDDDTQIISFSFGFTP